MKKTLSAFLFLIFALAPHVAVAQQTALAIVVQSCGTAPYTYTKGQRQPVVQDVNGNVCTTAAVTATVSGFAPSLAYATCTATNSACASTAIPTNTGSVILFNAGTTTVSCTLASGAATGTTGELQIPASSGLPLATVYGATTYDHFACIDQSGSASNVVIASGGSGLPTGWGGGGGGSGGAVTIADGADVALGTTSDAAWSSGSGTAIAILKNIAGGIAGSIPAGTNKIGTVDPATIATWGLMSGTTPGTAPTNTQVIGGIYNSTAPTLTTGQTVPLQVGPRGGLLIGGGGYPIGSTPITISGTGTTGATTATLATGASVTTYICGFSIRANATAAATGNATVTGTITGTLNYTQWTAPNASGLGVTEQIFTPCIPASAVNTGIAVISAAPGTGGVVSVTAWGFTL
jgi:hypothetical protein